MWESMSSEQKHGVASLAVVWQTCHAWCIEHGMPASLPEVSDDNPMMEKGCDIAPNPRLCMLA